MKIKYDFMKKYVSYQNEAYGIFFKKKKLKKNPNTKIEGYLRYSTKLFFLFFVPLFFLSVIFYENSEFLNIMSEILTIIFLIYYFAILLFFIKIFSFRIKKIKGTIEVNKDEILDILDVGLKTGISYNQIDSIVITDRLTVIITKLPLLIIFTNENLNKNKFINTIKKINEDIQIIDKTEI